MLDHITIIVRNYEKSKVFYTQALKPLGYSLLMEIEGYAGFGDASSFNGPIATFWLYQGESPSAHTHIAFRAKNQKIVDDFYNNALAAGGQDNGAPGIRAHYHPHYYGAFVFDPDGNNIEAVCHEK